MTEPVIVRLEEFHIHEIFQDPLPQEAVAALVSFPSFAMEYGEKTLAAGGAIQIAPGRVRLWLKTATGAELFPVHIFRTAGDLPKSRWPKIIAWNASAPITYPPASQKCSVTGRTLLSEIISLAVTPDYFQS